MNLQQEEGLPYTCDNDKCYPWYSNDSIVTLEGKTDQYSIVHFSVRKTHKIIKTFQKKVFVQYLKNTIVARISNFFVFN